MHNFITSSSSSSVTLQCCEKRFHSPLLFQNRENFNRFRFLLNTHRGFIYHPQRETQTSLTGPYLLLVAVEMSTRRQAFATLTGHGFNFFYNCCWWPCNFCNVAVKFHRRRKCMPVFRCPGLLSWPFPFRNFSLTVCLKLNENIIKQLFNYRDKIFNKC